MVFWSTLGLFILGTGVVLQPLAFVALLGAAGYFWICLTRPVPALGALLFVHIAFPAYIHIPPSLPVPPSILMLAALVGSTVLAALLGRKEPALGPRGRRFAIALVIFGVVGLFSIVDPRSTGELINMWIKVVVFPGLTAWVILRSANVEDDIHRIFVAMLAAGCLTALFGIYEYATGSNYLLENFMDQAMTDANIYRTGDVLGSGIAYRSFSVSSQPIEFGTWLAMLIPYTLIRFTRASTMSSKALFAILGAILMLGILMTFSRGCLLAVTISLLVLGVVLRPLRIWLASGLVGLALATAVIWPYVAEKVTDRASDVGNVTLRFKLWQTAFAIFADNPVKGVGLGNFPEYQLEAVRNHGIGPFYEFGLDKADLVGVAEQTYLQLAAETGIIGLLAFAGVLVLYFGLSIGLARSGSNQKRRDLTLCLAVSGLTYLVNGMTITAYTHYIPTLIFLGAFVGFLLVMLRAEDGYTSTTMSRTDDPRIGRLA